MGCIITGPEIQAVSASGTTQGGATEIVRDGVETVVVVTTVTSTDEAVIVPSDAEVGDVIEVYWTGGDQVSVFLQGSDGFVHNPATSQFAKAGPKVGFRLRKVASDLWGAVT